MHIKDAGYREIVWALYKAGSSKDAIGATYDPHTDVVTLPSGERTKVQLEATEVVERLYQQGYDAQGIAYAIGRIKEVE